MKHCIEILPSEMYAGESGTTLAALLTTYKVRIVAFRPPSAGELYIPSYVCHFEKPEVALRIFDKREPRFIVESVENSPEALIWE